MKKYLSIFMTLAMLLSLCACGSGNSDSTIDAENSSTTQTITVSNEQNNNTEEKGSLWEINYYVDDFNQPTEDWYIKASTYFLGTFSNSATTDSKLLVDMVVDESDITIFLYEYGNNQVKNNSSSYDDLYNITMKTNDGTKLSFTGTMYCGDDRIFIDQAYISQVISALSQEGNAMTSFYIEDAERTVNNYLFTVISNNFAEQYASMMG